MQPLPPRFLGHCRAQLINPLLQSGHKFLVSREIPFAKESTDGVQKGPGEHHLLQRNGSFLGKQKSILKNSDKRKSIFQMIPAFPNNVTVIRP
jgi:hypothetical protein